MGLVVSAVLSTASVVLFFYPGLNLGIDFSGGIVMEVRTPGPADFGQIRAALAAEHIPEQGVQQFGDAVRGADPARRRSPPRPATQQAVTRVRAALEKAVPGARSLRTDAVGAVGLGGAVPQRPAGARDQPADDPGLHLVPLRVAVRRRRRGHADPRHHQGDRLPRASPGIEFDLVMVAAILTILGYSTNDKVVVYDRVRENLRKYKTMPLRELIDLSINETLNRTLGTSMTVFLASLPLALFGGESHLRLRLGDAVRHRRRHLVLDLHRRADPVVPGRAPPAPRRRTECAFKSRCDERARREARAEARFLRQRSRCRPPIAPAAEAIKAPISIEKNR